MEMRRDRRHSQGTHGGWRGLMVSGGLSLEMYTEGRDRVINLQRRLMQELIDEANPLIDRGSEAVGDVIDEAGQR